MNNRDRELMTLQQLLRQRPVVGIVGGRKVGKTTLARMLVARSN